MKIRFVQAVPPEFALLSLEIEDDGIWLGLKTARETVRVEAGTLSQLNRRRFMVLIRRAAALAREHKVGRVALELAQWELKSLGLEAAEVAEAVATNAVMADYAFVKYRSEPAEGWPGLEELVVVSEPTVRAQAALQRGITVGEAVNQARDWSNTPAADMTPADFARAVQAAAKDLPNVQVEVLDRSQLEELGAGGILAVASGSVQEPKLVVLEYHGADEPPLALVGKGVMFDSGGLNLKPSTGIGDMHMDMSGGAAVVAATLAAAKLGLKRHVVAAVAAVENMPSGSSYHPADVVRTLSGKTIEVRDTDAEGRVTLADVLAYVDRFRPRAVVDVATLAGAAMVALGHHASAVFAVNDRLRWQLVDLGEASGDYVWPLPLGDEYVEEIKGTFGDWANVGRDRMGGASHAAVFLQQFVSDPQQWAHIDMAPRMTPAEGEYLAKGAAGVPVRLLIQAIDHGLVTN